MPRLINAATSFVQQGKHPAFRVQNRSNASFTANGTDKLTWSGGVIDTVGGWSSTNNRYVVKVKGLYVFAYEDLPYFAGAGSYYAEFYLYKNGSSQGTLVHSSYQSTRNYEPMYGTIYSECEPGDYYEVYRFTGNSATSNSNSGYARFSGTLVSV